MSPSKMGPVVLLAALILPASALAAPTPQQRFDRGAHAAASSGAWAIDTATGRVLISRSENVRRVPASVQKLLTSSAALERMGSAFRFETRVLADATITDESLDGSLYIKGAGDPSFTSSHLARLARDVSSEVSDVSGRVYGDESLFDSRRGTPASGFAISFYIGPLTALAFNSGYDGGHFQTDPPRFVAQRLRSSLVRGGVDVAKSAQAGHAPTKAQAVASSRSQTLAEIVRRMNQPSDNFYAETLIKALGARIGGGGSTAVGAGVIRDFERAHGLSSRVIDGSGLSRGNAIAPRAIGRLLTEAQDSDWFPSFHRSLPLAGHSGTLAGRMRGTAADGRCRAKTGTLSNVSALAGYCRARNGHRIAFAILMNGINVPAARAAQDRTVASLAAYSG